MEALAEILSELRELRDKSIQDDEDASIELERATKRKRLTRIARETWSDAVKLEEARLGCDQSDVCNDS